jgi:hypothetical protein
MIMKNTLHTSAKLLIGLAATASAGMIGYGVMNDHLQWSLRFVTLAVAAVVASRFKIKLPGMTSNMSGNLPILLLTISQLGLMEALLIAIACALTQSYASGNKKPMAVQVAFNTATIVNATGVAAWAFHIGLRHGGNSGPVLAFALAAASYFMANTLPVASIIAINEAKSAVDLWRTVFFWTFPNYAVAAGMATMADLAGSPVLWKAMVPLMLALFAVYRCYLMYASAHNQEPTLRTMAAVAR